MKSHQNIIFLCSIGFLHMLSGILEAGHATRVMEATFKFVHPASTATCFLVESTHETICLITAAHTLERTQGNQATLALREKQQDGSYLRINHPISIRQDDQPLWTRHPKLDVAVLRLSKPLPMPVILLTTNHLAKASHMEQAGVEIGDELTLLSFPLRFEANGAGFPVARRGIFASPPELPVNTHPTFLADYKTFAGDSGGPVFIEGEDGQPIIVGIVISQHHHEIRSKNMYEETVERFPLGLGNVIHATFIRETIEMAEKRSMQ